MDLPDSEPTRIAHPEERNELKNRRSFTPEYKDEAAKMVVELSQSVASVARDLGLTEQTLRNWVNKYRKLTLTPSRP
ncbi:MAG: transposase [Pseudonocardiaceae bacterium]